MKISEPTGASTAALAPLLTERAWHRRKYLTLTVLTWLTLPVVVMVVSLVLVVVWFGGVAYVTGADAAALNKAMDSFITRRALMAPITAVMALIVTAVALRARRFQRMMRLHDPLDFERPVAVYLRPFETENKKVFRDRIPNLITKVLDNVLWQKQSRIQLLAIHDRQDDPIAHAEIRAYDDDAWRRAADLMITNGHHVFMFLQDSPGMRWEFLHAMKEAVLKLSVFLPMEPDARNRAVEFLRESLPAVNPAVANYLRRPEVVGFRFTERSGKIVAVPLVDYCGSRLWRWLWYRKFKRGLDQRLWNSLITEAERVGWIHAKATSVGLWREHLDQVTTTEGLSLEPILTLDVRAAEARSAIGQPPEVPAGSRLRWLRVRAAARVMVGALGFALMLLVYFGREIAEYLNRRERMRPPSISHRIGSWSFDNPCEPGTLSISLQSSSYVTFRIQGDAPERYTREYSAQLDAGRFAPGRPVRVMVDHYGGTMEYSFIMPEAPEPVGLRSISSEGGQRFASLEFGMEIEPDQGLEAPIRGRFDDAGRGLIVFDVCHAAVADTNRYSFERDERGRYVLVLDGLADHLLDHPLDEHFEEALEVEFRPTGRDEEPLAIRATIGDIDWRTAYPRSAIAPLSWVPAVTDEPPGVLVRRGYGLPHALLAKGASLRDVTVVVDVELANEDVGTCGPYKMGYKRIYATRRRNDLVVAARSARDGEVIARETFAGAIPICPDFLFGSQTGRNYVDGSVPTLDIVGEWVIPIIAAKAENNRRDGVD